MDVKCFDEINDFTFDEINDFTLRVKLPYSEKFYLYGVDKCVLNAYNISAR